MRQTVPVAFKQHLVQDFREENGCATTFLVGGGTLNGILRHVHEAVGLAPERRPKCSKELDGRFGRGASIVGHFDRLSFGRKGLVRGSFGGGWTLGGWSAAARTITATSLGHVRGVRRGRRLGGLSGSDMMRGRLVLRLMQRPVQVAELVELNLLLLSLSQLLFLLLLLLLLLVLLLCLAYRAKAAKAGGQGSVGGELLGRSRH